jgi:DNA-binding transcriptional LysR family regulator
MTFEQMRIFLEAAHFGSFTHAAERLGLTQSAVSVSVKKLEEKHHVLLFDRSGRRLILTDAGQVLLSEAERILRDVELTVRRVESRRITGQSLVVGCTPHAYDFWMPELCARASGGNDAAVDLVRGSADEVTSWVMRGTADIGITSILPSHPQFRQVGVFADRLILCAHPQKARELEEGIAWAQLGAHAPVLWEQGDLTPTFIAALSGHQVDASRIAHPRLKLASSMAVISALLAGRHPGFVPERAARALLASGALTRIGVIEIPVRYWMFALRERELEPFATEIAQAAGS